MTFEKYLEIQEQFSKLKSNMTFEEYLEVQGRFSKIDTPEDLAIIKRMYEGHHAHVEDGKYFEPFEFGQEDTDYNIYDERLLSIFEFDMIRENEFFIMIKPSFEPEQLLVLINLNGNYIVKQTALLHQYWSAYNRDPTITAINSKSMNSRLPGDVGDKLFTLLNNTITNARKSSGKWHVMDGTVYTLSKLVNGKLVTVKKHSPQVDYPAGKIIAVLEQIIEHISNLDDDVLNDIGLKIDALLS